MKPQPNIFRSLNSILLITCTLLFGCGDGSDYQEPSDTYSLVFLTGPFEGEKIILSEGNVNIGEEINSNDISAEDEELLEALKTVRVNMEANDFVTLEPSEDQDYELYLNGDIITSSIELQDGDLIDFIENADSSFSKNMGSSNSSPPTTLTFSKTNPGARRFYAIAHMANTATAVTWALRQGANGVEIDLNFDDNGNPTEFKHGLPCDCTCSPREFWPPMCIVLGDCSANSSKTSLLEHIAHINRINTPGFALVVIDSKLDKKDSGNKQRAAGRNVVKLLEDHLFSKGYNGKVIIGAPHLTNGPYMSEAGIKANSSPYKSQMYFTIDMGGDKTYMTVDTLIRYLPNKNRVYGTGISACVAATYYDAIRQAVKQYQVGTLGSLIYIWTLDKESSMRKYIDVGVNGIMTNDPGKLVRIVREKGLTLAGVHSPIAPARNNQLFNYSNKCDCDYHPGGCSLSLPAPRFQTCDCKYKGGWTCGGDLVTSCNRASNYCINPDLSLQTCTLGKGDCLGYSDAKCDCNYKTGGCVLSKLPPHDVACDCKYKGGWTCGGSITYCSNPSSYYCTNPDYSEATCKQGRGDCGGY